MPVETIVIGLVFSLLCKYLDELIRHVHGKTTEFSPLLNEIKMKTDVLQPVIRDMELKYQELDRPSGLNDFRKVIADGAVFLETLSQVSSWYKKPKHTKKLKELDESLNTQMLLLGVRSANEVLNTSMSAATTERNTTNICMQVGEISMQLGSMSIQIENTQNSLNRNFSNLVEMVKDVRRNGPAQNQAGVGRFGAPSFTVGLEKHLDELKKKLVADGGVSMVLIAGHAGGGKTTLATMFCQDEEVKGKFNSIIFVDVSKRSNTEVVQDIFAKTGAQILDFKSEQNALPELQQLLKITGQDHVLLVLDDVWHRNESLLASLRCKQSERPNYKILVTSRHALLGFDYVCHVEELNEEDAVRLLHSSACLSISPPIPVELQKEVVRCCKKLPLFIDVVGRSLFGKDIVIWKDLVASWSTGSSIITDEKQLRACLQSSLDALGEENADTKECFMDLASFPQGRRIPASILIDMWTVLIDKWSANKDLSCFAKLYELAYASLATLIITRNQQGYIDDYYGEHYLSQHDLLRDLAIHLSNEGPSIQRKRLIIDIHGNKFPRWWISPSRKLAWYLYQLVVTSLLDSHFKSKWCSILLPNAKVLVLNFDTKNYGLPEFVEKMKKLKILLVTNYGLLPAEVSNFSLLGCLSKLKRIRLQRISISSITENQKVLEKLQKISFFMCSMGQAFSRGSIKFFEAFPNLEEINIDFCSDLVELPADICDQIQLKKLSVTNCHKLFALPKEIGKMENLELLRLRSCSDLSVFPDSIGKLGSLKVLDISYCISIKELPEHIGEMCCLETLNMTQCSRLRELPESILDLEKLTDVICDHHTIGLWEPYMAILGNNITIREVKEIYSLEWLHQ